MMRTILIIGAGKSTASLVKYLLDKSKAENLQIRLADKNKTAAVKLIDGHPNGCALEFDIFNTKQRRDEIQKADIVVSMLPARFHIEVAKDCLNFGKNMVTASYVSHEMQALNKAVEAKGLLFLNEMGVDPGIDHMSAMQVIDRIKAKGGEMIFLNRLPVVWWPQKVMIIYGSINLLGIQEMWWLQDKGVLLNLFKRGNLNTFPTTDCFAEPSF